MESPNTIVQPKDMVFKKADFWVEVHSVPKFCVQTFAIQALGTRLGDVLDIDSTPLGGEWEKFVRIRVRMDITRPLRRGLKYLAEDGGEICFLPCWYEKLPEFCFDCDLIGHSKKECANEEGKLGEGSNYGSWLRTVEFVTPLERRTTGERGGRGGGREGYGHRNSDEAWCRTGATINDGDLVSSKQERRSYNERRDNFKNPGNHYNKPDGNRPQRRSEEKEKIEETAALTKLKQGNSVISAPKDPKGNCINLDVLDSKSKSGRINLSDGKERELLQMRRRNHKF